MDRTDRAARAVLLVLFFLVAAYQLRWSLETIELQRHLSLHVPFLPKPFTSQVGERAWFIGWDAGQPPDQQHTVKLTPGDEILAAGGSPFRGLSVYLRELEKTQRQPPPDYPDFKWTPFRLTLGRNGAIREVDVSFPHCTCGVPGRVEAAMTWLVAPLFCILLGFATALVRPRSMAAWAFLGVMLSLSQLQTWRDLYPGFQNSTNAMAWNGWTRVPAVAWRAFAQDAWPAALLAGVIGMAGRRRWARLAALVAAGLFVIHAGVQAGLQVAWSENYRPWVGLHQSMERFQMEFRVAAFAGVAGVAWLLDRRLGAGATAAALAAATAPLYWHAGPLTTGTWFNYSDGSFAFAATVPPFHGATGLIVMAFAAVCVAAGLLVYRRRVGWRAWAGVALWAPFLVHVGGALGGFWFGPMVAFAWPWTSSIILSAAAGLFLLARKFSSQDFQVFISSVLFHLQF